MILGDIMKVIGIIGGIGSGKTQVAEYITNNFKAYLINADKIGHEALEKNTEVYKEILSRYGKSVLDADGGINRKLLGEIVFSSSEDLMWLNSLTHPYIKNRIIKEIEEYKSNKDYELIILEAAILIEAGWKDLADYIILVKCSEHKKIERLIQSRGVSEEKVKKIISKQSTDVELEKYSDYTIDNSLNIQDLFTQTHLTIEKILEDKNE